MWRNVYLWLQASDTELPTCLAATLFLEVGALVLSYRLYNNSFFWLAIQRSHHSICTVGHSMTTEIHLTLQLSSSFDGKSFPFLNHEDKQGEQEYSSSYS